MLNQTDMASLLSILIALEHKTTVELDSEDYRLMTKLAKSVNGTPDFYIRYFEGKANAQTA